MNILITGSSGLIGSAASSFLEAGGHTVTRLVRSHPATAGRTVLWDPARGAIDMAGIEGQDAVIHLAGENIGSGRWTAAKKARIRASRIDGTKLLCESLSRLNRPPRIFVSASAIGYYGDRGEETLQEEHLPGATFLSQVCEQWEKATRPAARLGMRVVQLRFGVVLSAAGGALAKMLTPFRLGLGGVLGSGRQYMSWITLDDAVGAIFRALITKTLAGPVNAVSPYPVTNREFTLTLGRVLGRPTVVPMPAFAARLAFGEMADELLLASARVEPIRLIATGYHFLYPELEPALRHLMGASQPSLKQAA